MADVDLPPSSSGSEASDEEPEQEQRDRLALADVPQSPWKLLLCLQVCQDNDGEMLSYPQQHTLLLFVLLASGFFKISVRLQDGRTLGQQAAYQNKGDK